MNKKALSATIHGMSYKPLYKIWVRIHFSNRYRYKEIEPKWKYFQDFLDDMPQHIKDAEHLSLKMKNKTLGYTRENVQFYKMIPIEFE